MSKARTKAASTKRNTSKCNIPEALREDVYPPGTAGVTEEDCVGRGGCWEQSGKATVPSCYKKDDEMIENQLELLCGKHALNNMLLEEKFVWVEDGPLLIGGADPKNPSTKINLWQSCELYAKDLKQEELVPAVESKMKIIQAYLSCSNVPNRVTEFGGNQNLKDLKAGKSRPIAMHPNYLKQIKAYSLIKKKTPFEALGIDEQLILSADMDYEVALENWKTTKSDYDLRYGCKELDDVKDAISAKVLEEMYISPDSLCVTRKVDPSDEFGQLPIQIFPKILDMLSFEYEVIDLRSVMKDEEDRGVEHNEDAFNVTFSERIDAELDNPQLLGVLITNSIHWICISKYSNLCDKQEGYALVDSLKSGFKRICRNKAELVTALAKYEPVGAVFVYAKSENAYLCKAVKKMRAKAKKGGARRTRITRRR